MFPSCAINAEKFAQDKCMDNSTMHLTFTMKGKEYDYSKPKQLRTWYVDTSTLFLVWRITTGVKIQLESIFQKLNVLLIYIETTERTKKKNDTAANMLM